MKKKVPLVAAIIFATTGSTCLFAALHHHSGFNRPEKSTIYELPGNYSMLATHVKTYPPMPVAEVVSHDYRSKQNVFFLWEDDERNPDNVTYEVAYQKEGTNTWVTDTTTREGLVMANLSPGNYVWRVRVYPPVPSSWSVKREFIVPNVKRSTFKSSDTDLSATFSISPNPANTHLRIDFNSWENNIVLFSLTDFSGNIVLKMETRITEGNNAVNMDLSDLPAGVYMVQGEHVDGSLSRQKLIIRK